MKLFPKKNTFAFRLNLYVVSSISFIAFIIFTSFYIVARDTMLSMAGENAKNTSEKYVNQIDAVIDKSASIPLNFAKILESSNPTESELISLLHSIVENNKEIYGSAVAFEPFGFDENKYYNSFYVYKDDGKIITTDLNDPQYEYFYQDWYQIPAHLHNPIWSEPYYDEGGGNIVMSTFSVPFYKIENGLKNFWGIMTIDIALDWLDSLVSSIKIYESGFAFVISHSGTFVTHPNHEYIMNHTIFSLAEEYERNGLREVGRKMINGKSGFEPLKGVTISDATRIYYTPFASNTWSLGVIFPDKELYADLNNLSLMIIGIGIFGLVFIIFSVTRVSKKMSSPLSLFAKAVSEIGSGKVSAKLPEIKSEDEIGELYHAFQKMQSELDHYIENLKKTTADKEKIESELRIAHKIQMDMLPKIFPPFPDREDVDLHAFLYPAKEVGGDLYDFFFIDDSKLVVLIGDVAGKGVPASLFMAVTRTLIRSKMMKGSSTEEVVRQINLDLMENNDSKLFVTLLLCIIDIDNKTMQYTNAGHNPPYIVTKDGNIAQLKERHGMAVGLFDIKPYVSSEFQLKDGDKFVLYTDGVNEAMNTDDEEYNYERLEKVLVEIPNLSAGESTDLILKDIKDFTKGAEQSDDITLMVVGIK